jgi:hypothetical protein
MAQVYNHIGVTVARMTGDSEVMDVAAGRVRGTMVRLAARHVRTGSYIRRFSVERARGKSGVIDRLVVNDDPAALSIETTHLTRPARDGRPRTLVAGLRIMARAARETPSA